MFHLILVCLSNSCQIKEITKTYHIFYCYWNYKVALSDLTNSDVLRLFRSGSDMQNNTYVTFGHHTFYFLLHINHACVSHFNKYNSLFPCGVTAGSLSIGLTVGLYRSEQEICWICDRWLQNRENKPLHSHSDSFVCLIVFNILSWQLR